MTASNSNNTKVTDSAGIRISPSCDSTSLSSLRSALGGRRLFCSWSGGKDSCLSLYKAIQAGGVPAALITMMTEGGERSRSHGLRMEVIRAQADALGIPLVTRSASWGTYEGVFKEAVREFVEQGITTGVFGDIDLDEHREWCVRVCREAGATAVHPLWKMERMDAVREFLDAGFQAHIVAMKDGLGGGAASGNGSSALSPGGSGLCENGTDRNRTTAGDTTNELLTLLGKPFDLHAVDLMVKHGIDACGEVGEFHTVVTGGPLFRKPLRLRFGEPVLRDGYWFVDAAVE